MNIGLSFETSTATMSRALFFARLEPPVQSDFITKNFGNDVNSIFIGAILIDRMPKQNRQRALKYNKHYKIKSAVGTVVEFGHSISIDILPNYDRCMDGCKKDAISYFASEIVRSMEMLRGQQIKYPDFAIDSFIEFLNESVNRACRQIIAQDNIDS